VEQGFISEQDLVELGQVIADEGLQRSDQAAITVADLTGVGVQDLQIAAAAASAFLSASETA
jgi:ornithine cyclodeaminase